MSFENHRVQEDFTATPFCTMTGNVNEPASFQLTHKEEGTLVSSSNRPSSSSPTTSTSVHYSSLQNPPPSPIQDLLAVPVKNPSTDFTSQLTKQPTHEIGSRDFAYGLTCALAELAVQNGHTFVAEENYEDYTAQSPFHQAGNCRTAAWVVLYQGTLGRPPFHGRDMIGPGSKIHLFDTALALCYTGFEQPMLYAELGGPLY
jgi:hypothetical protein